MSEFFRYRSLRYRVLIPLKEVERMKTLFSFENCEFHINGTTAGIIAVVIVLVIVIF